MNVSHVVTEKGFDVIGIAIRTTNKAAIAYGTIKICGKNFSMNLSCLKFQTKLIMQ